MLSTDGAFNLNVVALGLGAAVLFALGFVLQQRVAAQAPPEERLSLRLLVDLAQRPLWLAGIAAMVGGQVLGAFALAWGSLTLVEPLEATNLLFALPMAAIAARRRVTRRELVGAASLVVGLAAFVAAAGPGGLQVASVSDVDWLIGGTATLAAAAAFVVAPRATRSTGHQAGLVAAGAGTLYGLQDALTQRALYVFDHAGVVAALTNWQTYAVPAVAIVGLVLAQTAFEMAPLPASLPAITALEPLVGIALGAGLFAEHVRVSIFALAVESAGLSLMVVGIFVLGRSPFIGTGKGTYAQEPGPASL